MGAQMGGEALGRLVQRGRAAGGKGKQLEGPIAGLGRRDLGRFLNDHMGVGAAHAQRVDARPARPLAAGPIGEAVVDAEGAAVKINRGVRFFEVQAGRHLAVMQRQGGLDEAGHACGGIQMADIGFHAADAGKAGFGGGPAEGLGQGGHLDGIAQIGAGAVTFDVIHRIGGGACDLQRLGDAGGLAFDGGREIARLCRAVIVDGAAPDHGPDVIAVGDGIFQTPQHHRARARAENRALAAMIEGMADAIGREHLALFVEVAPVLRQFDRHPTRQRHVAFAVEQGLHGVVHGDERGGAGGLDRKGGPLQIEDVADAGGEEILVVPGVAQQEHARAVHQRPVGAEVEVEIAAHPAAREHADAALERLGRVAGILERFPRDLEEVAVLRIKDRRLFRREAEEFGIETVKPVQRRGKGDIGRILQLGRAFPGGDQFFLAQAAHGRPAVAQVFPVAAKVGRPGQMCRHADDGDVGVTRIHVNLLIAQNKCRPYAGASPDGTGY